MGKKVEGSKLYGFDVEHIVMTRKEEQELFENFNKNKKKLYLYASISKTTIDKLIDLYENFPRRVSQFKKFIINLEKIRIKLNKTKNLKKQLYILTHVEKYILENYKFLKHLSIHLIAKDIIKSYENNINLTVLKTGINIKLLNYIYPIISDSCFNYKKNIDIICKLNFKLILKKARRYKMKNTHIDFSEILQESFIGLIKAINKFDPSFKLKFSTYCVFWVHKELQTFQQKNLLISIPLNKQGLLSKINNMKNNRNLSSEEIQEKTNMDSEEVKNFSSNLQNIASVLSFQDPITDTDMIIEDTLIDEKNILVSDQIQEKDTLTIIRNILKENKVSDRNIEIFFMRYGVSENYTAQMKLMEIKEIQKITKQRVKQIIERCLDILNSPSNKEILESTCL